MLKEKTLEEHRHYLYEMVKLKLFFTHNWLRHHPEEEFSSVFRNRVDIYRKTDINRGSLNPAELNFDDPAWLELEQAVENLYRQHPAPEQEPEFEAAAFAVIKPQVDARCERDYQGYLDRVWMTGYQCGFLRHDLKVVDGVLKFHIANALTPDSFFNHPDYAGKCFNMLLDAAEGLGAEYLGTSTWLNSLPKWLEYFPEEWRENMSEERKDVQWHYGFWGQFISSRATYNQKLGDILRQTGELPYYPRLSKCTLPALRAHICQFYPNER